jgi:two-component system OmpR family response regulator
MASVLRHVLYVDDEPDIGEIVQFALQHTLKIEVALCLSGMEAVGLAERLQPDLIMLDVMLPGVDGVSLFKQLKASPPTHQIPVVFVTAKVRALDLAFYRDLGALGVIGKPFDPLALGDQLVQLWQSSEPTPVPS